MVVAGIAACAHPYRPLPPPAAPVFQRLISPFPVTDSTGHTYALPFLGGSEHPRPQLIDIDGDGVLDLFIQENSNDLALFQRGASGWRLATERFQNIDIGEWYRFVDLDGDGLYDLFAESPLSDIRYYRNVGTRTTPRFVVAADTLKDVAGVAIYADRQNIAQFADIDCHMAVARRYSQSSRRFDGARACCVPHVGAHRAPRRTYSPLLYE